jgi:hypothetical protein
MLALQEQASPDTFHEKCVQASQEQASPDTFRGNGVQAESLRRRIHRNQAKVARLMIELGIHGDPYLALVNGLQRSLASRIERLLADHPKYRASFEKVLRDVNQALKVQGKVSRHDH